jgi:hypothetical protein
MPWSEIARECEYPTPNAALWAIKRLTRRETHDDVEMSRAIHRERIELLMRSLWLAAINPGMAQQAARTAQQPAPPPQERAIELLRRLLDGLAEVEGTKAPIRAELTGARGGPIEGRLDVMHWVPDEAWMVQYVRVLKEAGMLNEPIEGEARRVGPGEDDTELAS